MSELPNRTASARDFRLVASKFDPGMLAPLTVVLESDTDLRRSEGPGLDRRREPSACRTSGG